MLLPKTSTIEYRWTGLGNLAREVVTSCNPQTKDQIHLVRGGVSLTLIAAASARKMFVLDLGNTVTWKSIVLNIPPYMEYNKLTIEVASIPAAGKSTWDRVA